MNSLLLFVTDVIIDIFIGDDAVVSSSLAWFTGSVIIFWMGLVQMSISAVVRYCFVPNTVMSLTSVYCGPASSSPEIVVVVGLLACWIVVVGVMVLVVVSVLRVVSCSMKNDGRGA